MAVVRRRSTSATSFSSHDLPIGLDAGLFHANVHCMNQNTDKPLPVALEQRTQDADQRMFSPSAARNAEPILKIAAQPLQRRSRTQGVQHRRPQLGRYCAHRADRLGMR